MTEVRIVPHREQMLLSLETTISDCCVEIQGGSNMTGIDLYVNKPHCAAAVRP